MKSIYLLLFVFLAACTSTRQTAITSDGTYQARQTPADGVEYAKFTFVADQKDFFTKLQGQWLIHTMQRQAQLPEETLNLALHLYEDRTFVSPTACGDITGTYSVKGVSIRFGDVAYNSTACEQQEKIKEMIRLLKQNVSLYTVNGNMLFLKDNSGNNVFRITR